MNHSELWLDSGCRRGRVFFHHHHHPLWQRPTTGARRAGLGSNLFTRQQVGARGSHLQPPLPPPARILPPGSRAVHGMGEPSVAHVSAAVSPCSSIPCGETESAHLPLPVTTSAARVLSRWLPGASARLYEGERRRWWRCCWCCKEGGQRPRRRGAAPPVASASARQRVYGPAGGEGPRCKE